MFLTREHCGRQRPIEPLTVETMSAEPVKLQTVRDYVEARMPDEAAADVPHAGRLTRLPGAFVDQDWDGLG